MTLSITHEELNRILSMEMGYQRLRELARENISNPDLFRKIIAKIPGKKVQDTHLLADVAGEGDVTAVNFLLSFKHSDKALKNAAHQAIKAGQENVLRVFVERFSPRLFNDRSFSGLVLAAGDGNVALVRLLSRVCLAKKHHTDALYAACRNGHKEVVSLLAHDSIINTVFLQLASRRYWSGADLLVPLAPLSEITSWMAGRNKELDSMPRLAARLQAQAMETHLSIIDAQPSSRQRL